MNDTMTVASLLTMFLGLCAVLVTLGIIVAVAGFLYRQFIDRYTIHPATPEATTLNQKKVDDGWETIATWVDYPDGRRSSDPADIAEFHRKWKEETGEDR